MHLFSNFKLLLLFLFFSILSACNHTSETEQKSLQVLPFSSLKLTSLDGFRQTEGNNWKVAGDVYANRKAEHHLQASDGTGVLVNVPDEKEKDNLFTELEHGDIDLEVDFMMPKGSNSGIYLQGRYEVQLLDSWLSDSVTFGDCGGIYQRWNNNKGFEGKAPSQNASRAPGLWQHLSIRFKAPRFDDSGKKTANARFEEVVLNGRVIQQNVEVSGPTRAAAFEDEKSAGPIMLQGDHGPVAFKNIRYKTYDENRLALKDMKYSVYKGMFTNQDTLQHLEPVQQGITDSISYRLVSENEKYTVAFEGKMEVPKEGDYLFKVQGAGPSMLYVDGKLLTDNDASSSFEHIGYGSRNLEGGEHSFQLIYINLVPWRKSLALNYEGPGIPLTKLTAKGSEPGERQEDPLVIKIHDEPVLQRGFMNHQGIKKTHTTAIGIPGQVNYAYDQKNHNILAAWRGGFVDVTEMWESRGEKQLEKPLGAPLELSGLPAVVSLTKQNDSWPDSIELENKAYSKQGYKFKKNGLPVFFYRLHDVNVEDYWYPMEQEKGLTREISFHFDQAETDIYCLVASGTLIEELPNGSYAIDHKRYYVDKLESGSTASPLIRNSKDKYELLIPVTPRNNEALVTYSVIW